MHLKFKHALIFSILIFTGCMKQRPDTIEQGFSETIERKRLDACSHMNLFNNLLEKTNIVATFDCTDWSKEFPVLRTQTEAFSTERWNNLLLPLSTRALNDRNVLKQAIAVTQVLEGQEGLDDLGVVITALTDTNFYDGMNELFSCAAAEECQRNNPPSKENIVDAFGVLEVLRHKASEVQVLATYAVAAMEELSTDFSRQVMKVLSSQEFIKKRVELLDLLVHFITQPRSSFERSFLPLVFDPKTKDDKGSLYTWVNSNSFNPNTFKELIKFTNQHPLAVKDLRSLAQIRQVGLKCESQIKAGFFVNLDKHIHTLLEKIRDLDEANLEAYLADDLSVHQLAAQACPNFLDLEVSIDDEKHSLNVVRMKKAMIDFLNIPGVYDLTKIVARDLLSAADGNDELLGNFMAKQMSKNYIGAGVDWLKIIDSTSPSLFTEYSAYLKAFPATAYSNLSSLMSHLVAPDQDIVWPAISKIWFFFSNQEKNFLFNYIDRHFKEGTNYKALFTYYLDIYSILMPSFADIVSDWRDNGRASQNFDGLKELAYRFHGAKALGEFKRFFSRNHILKVIELFINNGEQLTAWAQEVRAALPVVIRNQAHFEFAASTSSLASQCLQDVATSDLSVLIKDFPSSCRPLEGETLLEKIEILSQVNHEFQQTYGHSPFVATGLLAPSVVENYIIVVKKSFEAAMDAGASALNHLQWLKAHIANNNVRSILQQLHLLSETFPHASSNSLQEKIQLEVSNYISDKEKLGHLSQFLSRYAQWRKNGQWRSIVERTYPKFESSRSCTQELNQEIGGVPCPNLENFQDFIEAFATLLVRKNDESPLAVRQFINTLDPSVGFQIPYQGVTTKAKSLSIEESLRMFWELSDRSRLVNNKTLIYEDDSGKHERNVTTMERIEIVIRDVNFDANYLGAHYKNSVAKSYDYLKVVNSKYDMFKVCVGAKFCGKFMSRSERKMARNAVAAFPSLMDVHQDGLAFGDYMKALLGSVVASSSKSSQISSIVRFRRDRDGFNIPWIQTKKQLRSHNGVILSELAEIGAFSNMARWTRDRFGRNENDFKEFLSSAELNHVSNNLLRGFAMSVSDETLVNLLEALKNSKDILISDLWHWVEGLSYSELRRVEDVVGDILVIASSLSKKYPEANWDRLVQLFTWGVKNFGAIKVHWGDEKLIEVIAGIQPLTDFVAQGLLAEEETFAPVLIDLYKAFERIFLDEAERVNVLTLLNEYFNADQAKAIAKIVAHSSHLIKSEWSYSDIDSYAGAVALGATLDANHGGLSGFAEYLVQTSNKRACRYEGELVYCQDNPHYLETNKLLAILTRDESSWNRYVGRLFENLESLADWMAESLGLIRLE